MSKRYTLGTLLHQADKDEVQRRYVHRFTGNFRPAWANRPNLDGTMPSVQFASDAEWLSNTKFPVNKDGRLSARGSCYSFPTWPNRPDLQAKYGSGYTEHLAKGNH